MKHLDPLGSVLVPLVSLVYGGWLIGWAKPCPVTTRNFRHIRRDDILVSMAGPASNQPGDGYHRARAAMIVLQARCSGRLSTIAAAMATANHLAVRCWLVSPVPPWRCCSTTAC